MIEFVIQVIRVSRIFVLFRNIDLFYLLSCFVACSEKHYQICWWILTSSVVGDDRVGCEERHARTSSLPVSSRSTLFLILPDGEALTTTLFEATSTPLDILISENCATNRKVRVRLVRTVSSGHLLRECTHVSVCTYTGNPMAVRVCTLVCKVVKN